MPFLCCRAENLQCCVEFGQNRAKRCGDRIALRPVVTLIAGFVFLCVPVLIGSIVQYPKIKSQIDADDEANVAPIRESEAFTAALGSRLPGQFLYKNYDLVIVYELKSQGIFRVSQLMEVAKFERRLRALPEWSNLCLQVGAEFQSLCKDGLSLTNFVMATRQSAGSQSQIVPTALQFDGQGIEELPFTTINTILERYNLTGVLMPQVSLGESVSADALTGFRSIFRFRRIVKKVNDTQLMQVEARDRMNQEWTEFLEDALFPFLSEPQPSDTDFDDWPVHVWFTADTLDLELEVEREVVMDVRLAVGGAMSIVFVYMLLHTKSVFASLAGVLLLAFGPLVGYCVYAITAGTRSVSVVTVAILFPAVGLGVQTLLLYFHSWQESMENTGSYRECMNLTWKGAFSSTFLGAAIGASAFFGILPSGSYDMRQMCGYLFPMILLQWATITIFYVPVLALDERYMKGFRLRRCCGSRISFGHSAARRILGNKWTDVIGQWWRFVFAAIALLTVLLLALSMAYIKVENTVPQSFPVQHNQVQGRRAMARFAAPSAVLDAKFSPPPVSENVCSEETSSFDEPVSTSGSSGSGDPTSTSDSSETCGLMWCTAVAKAADDTSCTCYRQALERTYELQAGIHCGGNDIANWAGGGDSDLGRTDKTVAECKEICDSHSSECAGFTWDRIEGSCWWKTIAMDPYDDSEYDCYRVEGFYDYCIEGDLTTTTSTTSTTSTSTTSTTTNTTATTSTSNTTTSTTSTTTSTNSTTTTTTTTTNTTSTMTTNGTATTTATTTKTTKTVTTTTVTATTVTITTITTTIGTTTTTTTTQLLKAIQRFVGFSRAHLELGGVLDTAADGSWQMPFKSNQPLVQKPVLTAAPPLVLQEWESGNINLQPAVDAHSLFIGGPGMCSWRELCYCSTYKCTAPEGAAWGWSSPVTPSEAVLAARDGTPNSSATPTSGVSLTGVRPTSIYVIVGLNANYNTDGTGNTQLDALWTFADGYDPGVLWAQRHQHSLCADVPEAIVSTFGIAKKTCWIESFKKWVIRERDGRYPVPKTNFHTLLMQFLEQDNTTLSNTMWIRDGELKAWYAEFEVDIPLNVTELELSLYRQQWENYIETWRATSATTAQGSGKSAWVTSAIWMGVQEPPTNLSGLGITVGLVCTAAILMLACSIPRPGKMLLIGCAVVGLLPTIFGVLFIQAVILNEPLGFIETTAFIAIMGHAASYSYHVILCYHTGEDKHPQCNMGSAAAAALGSAFVTAGCSFFLAVGFLPVFRNIGALTFLGVPFAAVVSLTFLPATIELFIEVSGQGQEEYVAGAAGPGTPRNGVPESCVHIASTGSASDGLISQRSHGDVRDSRGGSASTVPSQMSEFTLDDGMGWVETRDSGDTGAGLGPTHNVS